MEIEEDVADIDIDISILLENDNFLFDEQVIQDERLLDLEETTLGIIGDLDSVEDEIDSEFVRQTNNQKIRIYLIAALH